MRSSAAFLATFEKRWGRGEIKFAGKKQLRKVHRITILAALKSTLIKGLITIENRLSD